MADMYGRIRVFCRIRPYSEKEAQLSSGDVFNVVSDFEIRFNDKTLLEYDSVFGMKSKQEEIFENAQRLVHSAIDGYKVCIFAYGATGSGKTFTIQGSEDNLGICPRVINELFVLKDQLEGSGKHQINIRSYMIELYKDKLNDLFWLREQLILGHKRHNLKFPTIKIHTNSEVNAVPKGAVDVELENYDQALQLYFESIEYRKQSATNYNQRSSRSHLVFSIIVENKNLETSEVSIGKISLIDLAGSEKLKDENDEAIKQEGIKINQSLSALHNVIAKLVSKESDDKDVHIPYNNNLLTKLMKDSLGGDSKTLMIACISPCEADFEQSKTTLLWSSNLKQVKINPKRHKEVDKLKKQIEENKAENDHLKEYVAELERKLRYFQTSATSRDFSQPKGSQRTEHTNSTTDHSYLNSRYRENSKVEEYDDDHL